MLSFMGAFTLSAMPLGLLRFFLVAIFCSSVDGFHPPWLGRLAEGSRVSVSKLCHVRPSVGFHAGGKRGMRVSTGVSLLRCGTADSSDEFAALALPMNPAPSLSPEQVSTLIMPASDLDFAS